MTEPTTPRGIAIVDASRAIGRAAENAGIAYERGEDLRCSNDERAETVARVELTRLVCEMEADLARVTAERDAALASRDEWRGVAEEGARLIQGIYFSGGSHHDMASAGRSLVAWSMRVRPIAEPDPLDKGPGARDERGGGVVTKPTTARGKAIIEAAREMADAAERAATAYEHGCVLTRSGAEDEAAKARAELDRLVCEWEAES